MDLLLATNNRNKVEEISEILRDLVAIRLLTPHDLSFTMPEPVEDGATLEANAYIKAREIHDRTGMPALADDTGLEVDALQGAPGVRSARYAGDDATYADNCHRLLQELDERSADDRSARFRTVICYVDAFRTLLAEGSVEGVITEETRGAAGFGYDPLFLPEGADRTFAEMSPEEKHAISHRGRALRAMHERLAPLLADCAEGT